MIENNQRPKNPKISPLPKFRATFIAIIMDSTIFKIGIISKNTHQPGFPAISANTQPLYIGIMAAQPGRPALEKTFHSATIAIITIIVSIKNKTNNITADAAFCAA